MFLYTVSVFAIFCILYSWTKFLSLFKFSTMKSEQMTKTQNVIVAIQYGSN